VHFIGFTESDFDAYLDRKWCSNVFNRERLQVKQKLEALGHILTPRLEGSDGEPLASEVSIEHPAVWNHRQVSCQHLFFVRNRETQRELDGFISRSRSLASLVSDPSPLHNHAYLGLRIDSHEIEVAFALHSDAAVDRENLERRSADFFEREKLLASIRALGPAFSIGITGHALVPCPELDDPGFLGLVKALPAAKSWLKVHQTFAREEVISEAEAFVDVAATALVELLPALHSLSWSRKNDKLQMRAALRKEAVKKKTGGLQKNDHVRIISGMLAGKTGIVQDVDAKGEVKVLIGTLAIKLKGDAVTRM